jgi:hypothetical protein
VGLRAGLDTEARWALELVWTQRLEEKSFASVECRTPLVQSVVRHCGDWAAPVSVRSSNLHRIFLTEHFSCFASVPTCEFQHVAFKSSSAFIV